MLRRGAGGFWRILCAGLCSTEGPGCPAEVTPLLSMLPHWTASPAEAEKPDIEMPFHSSGVSDVFYRRAAVACSSASGVRCWLAAACGALCPASGRNVGGMLQHA